MRDFVTLLILLLIVGAEGALWVENPMHIPAACMPALADVKRVVAAGGPRQYGHGGSLLTHRDTQTQRWLHAEG